MAGRSSVTLKGAEAIFIHLGATFEQHPDLGGYIVSYEGKEFQGKTLTIACQKLVCHLKGTPWTDMKSE